MIQFAILAAVGVVGGVLAKAATRPNVLHVQRSLRIKALPQSIYPHIVNFHNWVAWSPYEGRDPAMKRTYSGPDAAVGAVYEWNGDKKTVGSGRMEITDTTEPSKIMIKLDFFTPFEGHNVAEFTLEPDGEWTNVTWSMRGPAAFVTKLMGVFMDMDKMIGTDFEKGLEKLKTLVEAPALTAGPS